MEHNISLNLHFFTFARSWTGSKVNFISYPPMTLEDQQSGDASKYGMVGITANWFGDERWGFPSFFADSINEKGLSCSLLTLVDSQYEKRSTSKVNVFAGSLCKWAISQYASVTEVRDALGGVAIVGPDALAQHFVLRDSTGKRWVWGTTGICSRKKRRRKESGHTATSPSIQSDSPGATSLTMPHLHNNTSDVPMSPWVSNCYLFAVID